MLILLWKETWGHMDAYRALGRNPAGRLPQRCRPNSMDQGGKVAALADGKHVRMLLARIAKVTCGIEAGWGTRVVLGMVQADRARISDFMRSDGSLHRVLVVRPEVRPGDRNGDAVATTIR